MKTLIGLLVFAAVVLFLAHSPYDAAVRHQRERMIRTDDPATPLDIAFVWPKENSGDFFEGAQMAIDQINELGGVPIADAAGRKVLAKLRGHDYDEASAVNVEAQARGLAANPNLSAVIGYLSPDSAIRASITYEDNGVLYLSSAVSDLKLNTHGFRLVMQTIPDDAAITRSMISFSLQRGWRKAAVLYVRNTYGTTYADLLQENVDKYYLPGPGGPDDRVTMSLVSRDHYSEDDRSFYLLISRLLEKPFDVVIIADALLGDSAPRMLALIRQLREMGVRQPILGTEELHLLQLWQDIGAEANNVYGGAFFDYQLPQAAPTAKQFAERFNQRYHTYPSMEAGGAYEAVLLLTQAVARAHSKVPIKIATMFKSTSHWDGLQGNGVYNFDLDGKILGKQMWVKKMSNGTFDWPVNPYAPSAVVYANSFENLNEVKTDVRAAPTAAQEK